MALCGVEIAGADRDQPMGDRFIGAHAAAMLPPIGEGFRRPQNGAKDAPENREHCHRDQDHTDQHHQRGFDLAMLGPHMLEPGPRHHDLAGLIGEPGDAKRQCADHKEKKNDPDHCGLPSAASALMVSWRLAAIAALRA